MIRTQIRITPEQARALKRLSARKGKPAAELIRQSLDAMLKSGGYPDPDELRLRALAAVGKISRARGFGSEPRRSSCRRLSSHDGFYLRFYCLGEFFVKPLLQMFWGIIVETVLIG